MKLIRNHRASRLPLFALLAALSFSLFALPPALRAQDSDVEQTRAKAAQLMRQDNYVGALPLLEKLAQAEPQNADTQFYLGFALIAKSAAVKDKAERKQLRVRARGQFVKAKELGKREPVVDAFISSIPPDGGETAGFSANEEANSLMDEGEKAFTQGKIDEALALYQKALRLDPKIYEAALYSGDMYFRKNDYPNAETWYQKAITINPDRETAYRYSATPLMKQGKTAQARDRYVEAFITEPYNRFTLTGMAQWGEATGTPLGHPKIDVPEFKVGGGGKPEPTIKLGVTDDGSLAWAGYSATRAAWRDKKFAQRYPAEKAYRHTLAEEAEALRGVTAAAKQLKAKSKNFNPQLDTLIALDEDGLLEAFILMAIPDQDIAQDHPAYLKQNRDRLRQYVVKYVIGRGN